MSIMSHRQEMTLHPNRVYVKDLPKEISPDDLRSLFSEFGFRIRSTRVVETTGSTNYGFITFDSREAAEEIIGAAKSDTGILLDGKKLVVEHAFSRRIPPRKTSISRSIRDLVPRMNSPQQQRFLHPGYDYDSYLPSGEAYTGPTAQAPYSLQPSQQYANLYYDEQPLVFPVSNPGIAVSQTLTDVNQNNPVALPQNAMHEEVASSNQWHMPGQGYHYQPMRNPHSNPGNVHSPYTASHLHELHSQSYFDCPREAVEAPQMPEWPLLSESAVMQRPELPTSSVYHRHTHEYTQRDQAQAHQQEQFLQHHLVVHQQQQNMFNAHWVQHQYAMHTQCPSTSSESGSSQNYPHERAVGPEGESVDGE